MHSGRIQIDVDVEPRPIAPKPSSPITKVDALIVDWDLAGTDRLVDHLQTATRIGRRMFRWC